MALNLDEKDLEKIVMVGDKVLIKPKKKYIILSHSAIVMIVREEGLFE